MLIDLTAVTADTSYLTITFHLLILILIVCLRVIIYIAHHLLLRSNLLIVNIQVKEIIEEIKKVLRALILYFLILHSLIFLLYILLHLFIVLVKEWLKVEPAKESFILIFSFNQLDKCLLCQISQLDMFASTGSHDAPLLRVGMAQISSQVIA